MVRYTQNDERWVMFYFLNYFTFILRFSVAMIVKANIALVLITGLALEFNAASSSVCVFIRLF